MRQFGDTARLAGTAWAGPVPKVCLFVSWLGRKLALGFAKRFGRVRDATFGYRTWRRGPAKGLPVRRFADVRGISTCQGKSLIGPMEEGREYHTR